MPARHHPAGIWRGGTQLCCLLSQLGYGGYESSLFFSLFLLQLRHDRCDCSIFVTSVLSKYQ